MFASFKVRAARGTFFIEFSADGSECVWNVCHDPPLDGADLSEWKVLDEEPNYVVLEANQIAPNDAAAELVELATALGGEIALMNHERTERHPNGPLAFVRNKLRGLVGGGGS